MRRAAFVAVAFALSIAACGDDDSDDTGGSAGVANPASVYCEDQGGTVVIVTAADGSQSGRCRLPDGTEVDEWEYYRANHPDASTGTDTSKAEG